jgi:hypothetical protein
MNFVIYFLIYMQGKFCSHNFKSLKFTATFSWSPPFFPLKNASVFYTALNPPTPLKPWVALTASSTPLIVSSGAKRFRS